MNKKIIATILLCLTAMLGFSITSMATTTVAQPKFNTVIRKGTGATNITWYSMSGVSGFQIQYAPTNTYADATTITIADGTRTSKKISNMPTNKDMCIRMRAYKKLSDGTKVFSKWSGNTKIIIWKSTWKYAGYSKIHTDPVTLYCTYASTKKYKTIAVNAGHGCTGGSSKRTLCHPNGTSKVTGGSTSAGSTTATAINEGTTVSGMSEAAANLKIALKLRNKLLALGYNVLLIRPDSNTQLDNIARTVYANNNAHCHIAIHFDDTSSNKGAFYMSVPNVTSYRNMEPVKSHWKLHHALGNNLIKGFKTTGVKVWSGNPLAMDLTQTSYSTVASVDIEVGDRGTSTSDSNLTKIAAALAQGVKYQY